jgi:hypothetical protein
MVSSSAATPEDYLRELAPERAAELEIVRAVVQESIPDGFEEAMGFGMIVWQVPLEVCPDTYNGKPLMYAALAAQKNYSSLYLMPLYAGRTMTEEEFRARWSAPRRLDMGKSCVRFRAATDLDLPLIREVISGCTFDGYLETVQAYHGGR